MTILKTSICLGLGDNIAARIIFDTVKHQYSQIRIAHDQNIMRVYKNNDAAYAKFLKDIGTLLFTEPPYFFDSINYPAIHTMNTMVSLKATPTKSTIQPLLCKGTPLNLSEEYIVITTKIRGLHRKTFTTLSIQLWKILQQLSSKYKIIVMGEREVEKNFEYKNYTDIIYGIYEQIIANLPPDRVIDLTVPALGIVAPDLVKIQQDSLVMQQSKCVITLGLGGNVCLAAATANQIIGFRDDNDQQADLFFNPNFTSVSIYKDWSQFINRLQSL